MSATDSGRVRTLIVDDDETTRFVSRLMLEKTGQFTVVGEGLDGLEGIDLASEHQPDLVLLDITMPRMDGFEALPHILSVAPEAKVVVLSGLDAERAKEKSLSLGATAFFVKDADPADFVDALRRVCGIQVAP